MRRALGVVCVLLAVLAVQVGSDSAAWTAHPSRLAIRIGHSVRSDLSRPLRSMRLIPALPRDGTGGDRDAGSDASNAAQGESGDTGPANPPQLVPNHTDRPDSVVQTTLHPAGAGSRVASPSVVTAWNGIDAAASGGAIPPDTNGDVGLHDYVEIVNTAFEVFAKDGTPRYGPASINTLWQGFGGSCELHDDGDPIVLYDHLADRWVISQFTVSSPFSECIAVSQTGDPTGAWYRYAFPLSTTSGQDYPKLGVWPDGYYLDMRQCDADFTSCVGSTPFVFDRNAMLAGQPAAMQSGPENDNFASLLPADLDGSAPGSGTPEYFVGVDDQVHVFAFHVDWKTPANSTFTSVASLPAAGWTQLCDGTRSCVPQRGTSNRLDGVGFLIQYRLAYRAFADHTALVFDQTVDAGGGVAGVRWYEIRNPENSPVLYQQGTYAPGDGNSRWMGSTAMDGAGDLAIGYSISGPTMYPSLRLAGRLPSDALGSLPQGETDLFDGSGFQTGNDSGQNRWGDYSALKVDPADDCTLWYAGEYNNSDAEAWSTRITALRFPTCTVSPNGLSLSAGAQATAGSTDGITVRATDSAGKIATTYRGTVHFTSSDGGATLPADYTFTAADSGIHTFTVKFSATGSQTVTATDAAASFSASAGVAVSSAPAALSVQEPAAAVSGFSAPVTVTARTGSGATDGTYRGTVHFTSSDHSATLPADYTFTAADNGSHTFHVAFQTAGAESVTVTDSGNSSLTGTGSSTTVTIASTYVALAGSDSNDCLTAATPCATVQAAIDRASGGGTVTIAPGTYTGSVHIDRNLTLHGFHAVLDGGSSGQVLVVSGGVTATLDGLTLQHGTASSGDNGGGIVNLGTLTLRNTTVTANTAPNGLGGGIYNSGTLTISTSTVDNNSSPDSTNGYGGGIYSRGGSLTLVNATIANNSAGAFAGGIRANGSSLTIINSTIAGNSAPAAGGIGARSVTPVLTDSILATNSASTSPDCNGPLSSGGHSILGSNAGGCSGMTDGQNGDRVGVDPKLGALANNGGFVRTMALAAGSPALDAGDDVACGGTQVDAEDARGVPRPQGAHCDIGAFEAGVPPTAVSISSGWNMLSLLRDESGHVTSLSTLIAAMKSDGFSTSAVQEAATFSNGRFNLYVPGYTGDVPLTPAQAIFLRSAVNGTWTPSGNAFSSPQTVTLHPGWNALAVPFPVTGLRASRIADESGCNAAAVAVPLPSGLRVWTPGGADFTVPATSGVWLQCGIGATWSPQ